MEAERYASHVFDPEAVTDSEAAPGETTPTDTIIRADGVCRANARFIRPFDLGEHTFMEKRSIVNQRHALASSPANQTVKTSRRHDGAIRTGHRYPIKHHSHS
ncbi:hypothetical protein STUTZSP0542_05930 [Stutzerimonas marianensis]